MKARNDEIKLIKSELHKMLAVSHQICIILDKDDINIDHLNQIGKKSYLRTPKNKKNLLPNLIYYQGQIIENQTFNNNNNFKNIFTSNITKSDFYKKTNMKKLNDFHSNYFKILKGEDNDKIINKLLISKNFSKHKNKSKKEEKKIEKKLNIIVPEIMCRKKILTNRIPLYIKKYRKNYEYINNQLIMDEINEKRYIKYDDPFKYTMNRFPSKEVLPKYNNLFFKYEKSKIRDYFYKNTFTNFHSINKLNTKNNFREIKIDKGNSTSYDFNKNLKIPLK
jgi:hypothetical protein